MSVEKGTTGHVLDPKGVNHPKHYNNHPSGIEAIVVARRLNFNLGSAFKYVFRRGDKPEGSLTLLQSVLKNLDKAKWYLQDELANVYGVAPNRDCLAELRVVAEADPVDCAQEFYEALGQLSYAHDSHHIQVCLNALEDLRQYALEHVL